MVVIFLALGLMTATANARDAEYVWDSRCEQCHGDSKPFAAKYLWNMQGQLQGQHHIDDLKLFMGNHYIPRRDVDIVHDMLLVQANSFQRYTHECAECHGDARTFIEKSLWVSRNGITVMETGDDFIDFMPGHRNLSNEDVSFFIKLFSRLAGKPVAMETIINFK